MMNDRCQTQLAPQPPQPARPNPEPDLPDQMPTPEDGGEPIVPVEEGDSEEHRPGRASKLH